MKKAMRPLTLFTIIVLEGYVVLSAELLAIRETIPYLGGGTDTISIIIAAVLMPLALGYYIGGQFKPQAGQSLRKKLIFNILSAMIFLIPALSSLILAHIYITLMEAGITNRLIHAGLYGGLLIAPPVYLLGQTIPLVSNYFRAQSLSRITGKILFFSTLGSFLGAVFSTLVLMSHFGVNNTACFIFVILPFLVFLLSKDKGDSPVRLAVGLGVFALAVNSNFATGMYGTIKSNPYNTIGVLEQDGARHLILNNNYSSKYDDQGRKYDIIEFCEKLAINPILQATPPKEILVIGAGGFTFGHHDRNNHYDFVDIDKDLKEIAENYILREKLPPNKVFHAVPGRAFLSGTKKKYDVIFLDTYLGYLSIPEQLVTREFFQQVKDRLKDKGLMLANIVTTPNFGSPFSRHLDDTIRSVFPNISRDVMRDDYALWNDDPKALGNIVYIYRHHAEADAPAVYTDDLNRSFLDKP
ncbi:MAG: fused MFS/spermidine synthase [Alphaproteobacteria bacterium]|nr:fused MFS/spermidine synthase [Alphaproteobacteria bacterium]